MDMVEVLVQRMVVDLLIDLVEMVLVAFEFLFDQAFVQLAYIVMVVI